MHDAAEEAHLTRYWYSGGILHDEMNIQEDIVFQNKADGPPLVGWIDTGSECNNIRVLESNEVKRKLAKQIWQLTFLGYTGFRFPICHFPVGSIKASEMSIHIWKIIAKLSRYINLAKSL